MRWGALALGVLADPASNGSAPPSGRCETMFMLRLPCCPAGCWANAGAARRIEMATAILVVMAQPYVRIGKETYRGQYAVRRRSSQTATTRRRLPGPK